MPGKTEISQTWTWLVSACGHCQQKARNGRLVPGRAALMLSLAVAASPAAAYASPCGDQIAKLEAAQADLGDVPYARQSIGAQLHRQPTPGAVANAESEARSRLNAALADARKLNSEGKDSECFATLEKAGVPVGVH
jgi:hypothetical protein